MFLFQKSEGKERILTSMNKNIITGCLLLFPSLTSSFVTYIIGYNRFFNPESIESFDHVMDFHLMTLP